MDNKSASYSIIQYSPHPERYEFINIGVVIFDAEKRIVHSKFSDNFSRAKKFFKDLNVSYVKLALEDFNNRISFEFGKGFDKHGMEKFLSNRVNIFRATPMLPIVLSNLSLDLDALFDQMVSSQPKNNRAERIGVKLSKALSNEGVLSLLDKKPEVVHIPKYGVNIRAHYGYKNGVYNLIDAANFDDPEKGLAEAGKRALEGKFLAETLDRRLIVVGDFGDQSNDYFRAIYDDLEQADTKLFRLGDLSGLAREIKSNAS